MLEQNFLSRQFGDEENKNIIISLMCTVRVRADTAVFWQFL